ncbi:3-hydroxyisobutyryl-CoA hydrolase [Salininema proteolyticum]|uniref:3-hydroxyisobutyryl-CoA hydrolase n=1 Tax=Salininema proteolyticum TaxID=1607685 RepID=A0ABV8U2Y6_9ACTN
MVDFFSRATEDVLYARTGPLGRIVLNKPRSINALTHDMIHSLQAQLEEWAEDDSVSAVSVEGAGGRGLCSGGDVRFMRQSVLDGNADAVDFWADEYTMNLLIGEYPKPVVAFMDGVTMGGGVGVSGHASHRFATDRSRIAMPETAIGFSPDVGGMRLLSSAPGEFGTYMALTGEPVDGPTAVAAGFADAVVDHGEIPAIIDRLAAGESPDAILEEAKKPVPELDLSWIDECFAGDDPAAILAALQSHPSGEAKAAAEVVESRAPLSVAVALEAVRRAKGMSLADVLKQDLVLGKSFTANPDFVEGVRAKLVDKDNDPHWQHKSLKEVDRATVLAQFS